MGRGTMSQGWACGLAAIQKKRTTLHSIVIVTRHTDKNEIHKDISYEMKHRSETRKDKEVKAKQVENIIIEQSKNRNHDNPKIRNYHPIHD